MSIYRCLILTEIMKVAKFQNVRIKRRVNAVYYVLAGLNPLMEFNQTVQI